MFVSDPFLALVGGRNYEYFGGTTNITLASAAEGSIVPSVGVVLNSNGCLMKS